MKRGKHCWQIMVSDASVRGALNKYSLNFWTCGPFLGFLHLDVGSSLNVGTPVGFTGSTLMVGSSLPFHSRKFQKHGG